MSEYYTFHECFGLFNFILLFHGLSGFIFNSWNRDRVMLIGSVITIIYWAASGFQLIKLFVFNTSRMQEDIFIRIFNLIDVVRWSVVIFSLHFLNFFKTKKLRCLIQQFFATKRIKIPQRVRFLFNCALILILSYFYCGVLAFRWNYSNNNGVNQFDILIFCFQICVALFEQIFMVILMYQLILNLENILVNPKNVRKMLDLFQENFEIFEELMAFFGKTMVLYLLNFFFGVTFFLFSGFVLERWRRAFCEQLIWDGSYFFMIGCIYCIHQVSHKVSFPFIALLCVNWLFGKKIYTFFFHEEVFRGLLEVLIT